MAVLVPKVLTQGTLLTGSAATLYTTPASTTAVIRSITLCNTDASARTVTLYLIPSAGAAGDASTILKTQSLAAGETLIMDEVHVLATGDFVQGLASVTSVVSIRIDGGEYA